jgi:nitronate monooxygenase
METAVTMPWQERLGLNAALIQAPMAGSQDHRLAIAVAKAGALGSVPAAMLEPAVLRQQLQAVRDADVANVNVNFFCHEPAAVDAARHAAWRSRLAPFYREAGLDPDAHIPVHPRTQPAEGVGPPWERPGGGPAANRLPFGPEMLAVLLDFHPRIVSFHFGLPQPALLEPLKRMGTLIASSATTVDEARWLEQHGADIVIAQGCEAGGHRGLFLAHDLATQLPVMALVPLIVDAVKLPVIAAGGIADARGVAAAQALGAGGVQVGTAFLLCPEATTSAVHRAALLGVGAHMTALTNVFTGRPARGIVNRAMRELGPICADAPPFPQASQALAPLRAATEAKGDGAFSPLWSGQRGCPYRAGETAAQVVARLLLH